MLKKKWFTRLKQGFVGSQKNEHFFVYIEVLPVAENKIVII